MFIFKWRDIDIADPLLTDREQLVMRRGMQKVSQYQKEGRMDDAHGAASVLMIAYHLFRGIDPFLADEKTSSQAPL